MKISTLDFDNEDDRPMSYIVIATDEEWAKVLGFASAREMYEDHADMIDAMKVTWKL